MTSADESDSPSASDVAYGREVIALAADNVARGGRPFAALIVAEDEVLVRAVNDVASTHDPTDHAEMRAIRALSVALRRERLTGMTLYASCEPCVMCASAIRWADLCRTAYCLSREAAARYDFHDVVDPGTSREIMTASRCLHLGDLEDEGQAPFEAWSRSNRG